MSGLDPLTAIAEGAALVSAIMQGELPDSGFFPATEHTLGTVVLNPATQTLGFSPIIPRGRKLPASGTETYVPVVDDQEYLEFSVIEGDHEKPLSDDGNVILAESNLEIPNPGPMDEITFSFTYRYDLDGIVLFDVVDLRDQSSLHSGEIALGVQRDRQQMVDIAKRVETTLNEGEVQESEVVSDLDPEVAALVLDTRTKVAPFVEDDEAVEIREICQQIESSGGSDQSLVDRLQAIKQKYNYLF